MSKLTGAAYDELTGGVILQFKLSDFRVSGVTQRHSGEVIDYGVKMSGAPLEWGETMGEGIRIGVIDTGVDLRHEDLRGAIAEARNFVEERTSAVSSAPGITESASSASRPSAAFMLPRLLTMKVRLISKRSKRVFSG